MTLARAERARPTPANPSSRNQVELPPPPLLLVFEVAAATVIVTELALDVPTAFVHVNVYV
jgi:hypothetical protein